MRGSYIGVRARLQHGGARSPSPGQRLSIYSAEDLALVAVELNNRPRRTLDWQAPAERFAKLVATVE
ncbi:IS30 family transposase [Nonomuraea endophytica]|uniref:IS30 family transposase n=1 Tax=Nonomuraea endophytica TaxID=714136 RepID=A0A7W7ZZY6_9ACTN|nr:IS30 family transposase [Nonomuraea endophytica]